ncbi:MAG TPA: enoyl-CoA hydratase/isomerase family protein [Candidatus Elarobacter sp.]|nr:enoyl-CoA hydratase/isomerase family protein [Candidatus Elarobacter sp.]
MSEEITAARTGRLGRLGRVLINRPRALNALTGPMFAEIGRALDAWRNDAAVEAVVVRGAGANFSAGGDIRFVRDMVLAGDDAGIATMYADEYRLDAQIDAFPKPYVAAVDGYCMGGGLGVAMYADVIAVTERAQLAMPEVGIGFFPDVGASYVLPRLPDRIGWYMGLTGTRLSAFDAVACGLATHLLDDRTFERLEEIVAWEDLAPESLRLRFASVAHNPVSAPIDALRPAIRRCFDRSDLDGVFGALEREGGIWAGETLAAMRRASPTSLAITFELFRRGSTLTLAQCLEIEYQLAVRVCKTPEFLEGVRAMVIDKDRAPRWNPPSVERLSSDALEALWSEIDVSRNELGLQETVR